MMTEFNADCKVSQVDYMALEVVLFFIEIT